jgi:hypothetical protein
VRLGSAHSAGLGPVLSTAHGGVVIGWDISQQGSAGLLAEANQTESILEGFDLKTARINKLGSREREQAGSSFREFFVLKMLANAVGLVENIEYTFPTQHDTFPVLSLAAEPRSPANGRHTASRIFSWNG